MESLRQIGAGFLLALLSVIVVIGAFALSMAEGGTTAPVPLVPTASPQQVIITIFPSLPVVTESPQPASQLTDTAAPSFTPTASFTPPPPPASCLPPRGWIAITVQSNDTIASLAQVHQTSPDTIRQGNCLVSDQLVSGSFIYVPSKPTSTLIPCGPPSGWINYSVRPGDTLFSIGTLYHVSVGELQRANCLGSSTFIQAGKNIKVPNVSPITHVALSTWTATVTVEVLPTETPSLTLAPTEAPTSTIPPTDTSSPEPTVTETTIPSTND